MGAHLVAHQDRIRYGLIGMRYHATPPKIIKAFSTYSQIRFDFDSPHGIYANIFCFGIKKGGKF